MSFRIGGRVESAEHHSSYVSSSGPSSTLGANKGEATSLPYIVNSMSESGNDKMEHEDEELVVRRSYANETQELIQDLSTAIAQGTGSTEGVDDHTAQFATIVATKALGGFLPFLQRYAVLSDARMGAIVP